MILSISYDYDDSMVNGIKLRLMVVFKRKIMYIEKVSVSEWKEMDEWRCV